MSHLPIWFIGQIGEDVIDKANVEFKIIETKSATMGPEGQTIDMSGRNTTISFAQDDHWFGLQMFEFAKIANKECKWDFDIQGHEAVQYAEYGPKQHYHWHVDTFPLSGRPIDRKITVVCLMNDPNEFQAGQFQIKLYQEYTAPLVKGTIIAFPSFLEHRVIPIESGTRYSATMWVNGPRFR